MGGVALVVAADVLLGGAIHSLLQTGTCSSNGYSSQLGGPVQTCPKGSGLYGVFLPLSAFAAMAGGAMLASPTRGYGFSSYFASMGIGALSVEVGDGRQGPSSAFLNVFGGSFLVAGLAVIAGTAWNQLKQRRTHSAETKPADRNLGASTGGAFVAAVVAAALSFGLLHITAPGSTVELAAGSTGQPSGPNAPLGSNQPTSPISVAAPLAPACDILTVPVVQRALAADARQTFSRNESGLEECDYASASAGRSLRLEIVDDWTLLHASDPPAQPVIGLGNEAYVSDDGNVIAVRKGTRGIRITVLVPAGTKTTPARTALATVRVELLARLVLTSV